MILLLYRFKKSLLFSFRKKTVLHKNRKKFNFFVTYRVDSWVDWWVGVKAVEGVLTAGKKIEHLE